VAHDLDGRAVSAEDLRGTLDAIMARVAPASSATCERCDQPAVDDRWPYCATHAAEISAERERQAELKEFNRNRPYYLEHVGLPRDLWRFSFATLERTHAVEIVQAFHERGDVRRGRALGLLGPTGIGKTAAVAALVDACLRELRTSIGYVNGLTLVRELHDFDLVGDAMDRCTSTKIKLLVLDDLPRVTDDRVQQLIEEIFVVRESERLATVFTSNLTPKQLGDALTDRVRDRFRSWGSIHAIKGASMRRAPAATTT
jgi:DNA replication protein DnaC